jgi:hypothetical protein
MEIIKYKRNYFHAISALLLVIICFYRCSNNCVHDTGSMTTSHVETGYLKEMNINGIFDIFLVQDTVFFVDLKGGNKVLEYAQIRTNDSILSLYNTNSCSFLSDYKRIGVYIHFAKMGNLNISEPCNVKSLNAITSNFVVSVGSAIAEVDIELDNDNFFFYTNKQTAGSYLFKGRCNNCTLWGFYASKIDAANLKTRTMYVLNGSIADFEVNVAEKLYVEIHNSGNVIYSGSPIVQIDSLLGSGRVIKAAGN